MSGTNEEDDKTFAGLDFEEAMARVAQTDPREVQVLAHAEVAPDSIESLIDQFEDAGHDTGHGDKAWYARELQSLLGYDKWETFDGAIRKAITACQNAGHDPREHFREFFPETGKNAERGRPSKNYELSRYACYLIAQNASSRKKQVAFAQTYFAIQTRRQELADRDGVDFNTLTENQKRLYLRNQVVEQNKLLARAAKGAGVQNTEFGKFYNRGYQGLYGGRNMDEVRSYKQLPAKAQILDHMGSTELAANLFRITQTEERLRSKGVRGSEAACTAHYEVGLKVRQTMKELSGIMPEDLPVAPDVKKIAAVERKQQRLRGASPQERAAQLPPPTNTADPVEIDLRQDLWKYALLIASVRPNGEISTAELIAEMPSYIHLSDEHTTANASRKDSKFSQLVRNLKSHKTSKTNFIFQGFAEDIPGGFRITAKGLAFVREYFKN